MMDQLVNLLHEIGMLSQIPRSGFAFLGTGKQSVAEHSFRVATIAHFLAKLISKPIDYQKLVMICLLHDLPESRMGDLNYVQKKYVKPNLKKVLKDIKQDSPFGSEIVEWIKDYEKGISLESQIAHDADQIELLLMLKKEHELGNPHALDWFKNTSKRLTLTIAQELANRILEVSSNDWWIGDREDPHWIDGGKSKAKKRGQGRSK